MSYGRLKTPRFYMDKVNWLFSRGVSRNTALSINSGAGSIALNSGYTKYQPFDMDVSNIASFNSDTTTDTVSIAINLSISDAMTSLSILNHNLDTAGGKIRIAYSGSAITAVGGGTAVSGLTEVLNGTVSGGYATPAADGDTVLKFTSATARYWVVEFYDVSTWADDLTLGEIVLGEYYDMPHSPDMSSTKETEFEGVTVRRSVGGHAFGSALWVGANETATYTAFRRGTDVRKQGGREVYNFTTSYVADTDIYPSDRKSPGSSANFLYDVVNYAGMELIPFIFATDKDSSITGDYLWARFDQPVFTTTRQTWGVETFSSRIVQEF